MVTKAEEEVAVYTWTRLSFPLWKEPRPQFEFFGEVNKIFEKLYVQTFIRSNFDGLKESGDRKAWLEWTFDKPFNEATRMRIQNALEEFFGEEQGRNFCWDGAGAKTSIKVVRAIGPWIQ